MIKIAVCLKQVPDPASVEIDPLSGQLDHSRLAYITNPADSAGLALALEWRQLFGGEVLALSCGPVRVERTLREALSLGADRVIRLENNGGNETSPDHTARQLAETLKSWSPDLVICGNRSTDRASAQVPGYLAELLGLAQATRVTAARLDLEKRQILAERKLEKGRRESLSLELPALLAVETEIARPGYATLPGLMAAKQATIPVEKSQAPANPPTVRLVEMRPPRPRPRQIFVPDPDQPAAARIQAILNGGAAVRAKKSSPLEGSAETQAERLLEFLENKGYLEPSSGQD